ncbi:MAG: hypothetical protein P8Y18_11375 [Candidatus Bathyarchaeota archaeon]
MSSYNKEAIKIQIDLMEKEILYFKGKKREKAKKAYNKLLHLCGHSCSIDEPIFLRRSE